MPKILSSFLLFFIAFNCGYAQCGVLACDSEVTFCRYGENIVGDFFDENGMYQISFLNPITQDIEYTTSAEIKDNQLSFTLDENFPLNGLYLIECLDGGLINTCWGEYTIESCFDFIVLDECPQPFFFVMKQTYIRFLQRGLVRTGNIMYV